jgi:acetyl esterase/lipase
MTSRVTVTDAALEAMLRRRANSAQPVNLSAEVLKALYAAPAPRRAWLPRPGIPALPMPWPAGRGLMPILVAAALVLAVLAGVLVGGQILRERFLTDAPVMPDRWVLETVPSGPNVLRYGQSLVAVSAVEAWAFDDRGLWHFRGGSWSGPSAPNEVASITGIAVAPDGAVWASTTMGLAVFRDEAWTFAWYGTEGPVAAGADGTTWAGSDRAVIRRDVDGERTTTTCPGAGTQLAAGGRPGVPPGGYVVVGAFGSDAGLWVVRGAVCDAADALGDGRTYSVLDLEADGAGQVVGLIADLPADGFIPDWTGLAHLVRFDGQRWTILDSPRISSDSSPFVGGVLAGGPGDAIWAAVGGGRGIELYDGRRWTGVVPGPGDYSQLSSAPGGTLWFMGPSGIQRLRPEWDAAPPPTAPTVAPTAAPTPAPTATPAAVVATRDIVYESADPALAEGLLDVYAPTKPGSYPVAVMFHGQPGLTTKGSLGPWAEEVAADGWVVFVPAWGVSNADAMSLLQSRRLALVNRQAACAVAFARSHAAEYGGDPSTLVLFGHAAGANEAAVIAFNRPTPTDRCPGGDALGPISALITYEGDWLLMDQQWDEVIPRDPAVLSEATPWKGLSANSTLPVFMLVSAGSGRVEEPPTVTPPVDWRTARDPVSLRTAFRTALTDGEIDIAQEQAVLYAALKAQGNPVSLTAIPEASHESIGAVGWPVVLAAFWSAARQ